MFSPKKRFCFQSKKLCYLRETLECVFSSGELSCLAGGSTTADVPPSIFNVPLWCLPTKTCAQRLTKTEDKQQRYFLQNDTITSFNSFKPDQELQKKYKNVIISRLETKLLCLFMTENFSECILSIVVDNNPTLCCPLICNAFKKA